MENLYIKEVKTKSDLKKFVTFPDKLYKNNPYRVPPLHKFEYAILDKVSNPAFESCDAVYYLAYKNKKIVGRIAGIINGKYNELWEKSYARFGWIDFIDDYAVSELLLKSVEDWAKSKRINAIHGPLGFTDLDMEGMLIDGFEEMGTQAVIYNYPYYKDHMEKYGYYKDTDWVQYEIQVPDEVPERLKKFSKLIKAKYGVRSLKFSKPKDVIPWAGKLFKTLNESFKDLYGFVPLSDGQIEFYTKHYFSAVDPKYLSFIVDKNDDIVGFGITMMSLSKALIKAKGKLLPFGFIHILKALKKNDTIDMFLQGVRPDYQNKGITAIIYSETMQSFIDNNIKLAITGVQLEDNLSAQLLFDSYENRMHLKRRCFIKLI
jgi:hypothetical protein